MVTTHRFARLPLLVPAPYRKVHLGTPNIGGAKGLTIDKTGPSVLKLHGKATVNGSLSITVNEDAVTLPIPKGASAQQVVNSLTEALPGYKVAATQEKNQGTVIKFSLPL
jgi:phage tail sheath gpL-like